MAIDTAEKRRNISGLIAGISVPSVTPNAAQDVEWRQQSGWGYSGIAPATPPVAPAVAEINQFDAVPFTQEYKTRYRI